MFSPACCRGKHICLLAVCPTFRLAYSPKSSASFTRLWFLRAAQFLFPYVLGKFIFRPIFWLPLWAISHNDPLHAVCWGFRLSYCVNWLFTSSELLRELTVHIMLNFVHESTRFSSCSTEHLWIVSPQPRTPTTCRNRRHRRVSTIESVHGLYALLLWIFLCRLFVCALDFWLWLIDIYFWAQIENLSLIFCQCMNPLFKWGSLTFCPRYFLSGIPYHVPRRSSM